MGGRLSKSLSHGQIRNILLSECRGAHKNDPRKQILLAIGLIIGLLGAGSLGVSSMIYMSLEDYIKQSNVILIGKAVEKSTEPIKLDKITYLKQGVDETAYHSLRIEVRKVLKGKVIGKDVKLLYPVFKFHNYGKGIDVFRDSPLYTYTELDEWGKERVWLLAESKVETGFYRKVHITYSFSPRSPSSSLIEAIIGILQLGEAEQVAGLTKMLASDQKPFVLSALEMLSRRKALPAVGPIISLLDVKDTDIQDKACWALQKINDDAGNLKLIQFLKRKLSDKSFSSWMVGIIENFRDRRVVPVLIEALVHPDPEIKRFAISKLGDFRAGEAVESLLPFLDDPNDYFRYVTYEALGKIGDPKALPRLKRELLIRASPQERESITKAIQEIQKAK